MNLEERYRPRCLDDIVGQPGPVRFMRSLVANPQRCCILLESAHGGTGKTASAQALADELGCHDEFTGRWRVNCTELSVDAARELFGRTLRLRWGSTSGMTVLILEELEWVSDQCQRYLKDALDPAGNMPRNLVVIATSNGAGNLSKPLLQRFRIFSYSAGPTFRQACQERLAHVWSIEAPGRDLPYGWQTWGADGAEFSMRVAMSCLEDALLAAPAVAA